MKKMAIICMSALLAMAVSCKKEKKTESDGTGFRATVESQSSGSKTHLNSTSIEWNKNDEILVVNSNDESKWGCFVTQDEGTTSANFNSKTDLPDGFYDAGQFTAYYPASAVDNGGNFTLPATQQAVFKAQDGAYQASFGNGANPMVAKSTTTSLKFKNLCGILQLQLYSANDCYVKSITVTSKNSSEKLCGSGTVNWGNPNEPVLKLTEGSNSVTLECTTASGSKDGTSNGVLLGKNEAAATSFYIVVPAGTLGSGFKVTVRDANGDYCSPLEAPVSDNNTIGRNVIKPMPEIAVTLFPKGALPGKFSVAKGKQVYFSKGNLQYVKSTNTWQFAEHQYDRVEKNDQDVGEDYAKQDIVTLFGWGTSGWDGGGNSYFMPYKTGYINTLVDGSTLAGYGYGPKSGNTLCNLTGTYANADWGIYNAISNGGNAAKKWRTLTKTEWEYLLSRKDSEDKLLYGKGMIDTNCGLIILPDDWVLPSGLSPFTHGQSVWANVYTYSQWAQMEAAGAVFLPLAGRREGGTTQGGTTLSGTMPQHVGGDGIYWSSTIYDNTNVYCLDFYSSGYNLTWGRANYGQSVRLVSNN